MRVLGVLKTLQRWMARLKRSSCGPNGSSILVLPIGEPMALRRKPFLSRSDFNSDTCRSVRSSTLVLRMERNSMWRMPHCLRTSICFCGSGSISSAKALRVNIVSKSLVHYPRLEDSPWGLGAKPAGESSSLQGIVLHFRRRQLGYGTRRGKSNKDQSIRLHNAQVHRIGLLAGHKNGGAGL